MALPAYDINTCDEHGDDIEAVVIPFPTNRANTDPTPRLRAQLDNHLGSSSMELDDNGAVISYEEYFPYGGTSFRAKSTAEVSDKRYRYSGKERDEETGLYYYGARYLAAWLGRWTSADPAGMVDGPNRFGFVRVLPRTPNEAEAVTFPAARER